MKEKGPYPNSFCEAKLILIQKPSKNTTRKRKLKANMSDEHRRKILKKILTTVKWNLPRDEKMI